MKTCTTCFETKPLASYYKHPKGAGGYRSQCKDCYAGMRQRYRQTAQGKAVVRSCDVRYAALYPEKIIARNAINNAIAHGHRVPQPCEQCGKEKAQAHHDDYTKPLEVRWLCTQHHAEHHRNERRRVAGKASDEFGTKLQ